MKDPQVHGAILHVPADLSNQMVEKRGLKGERQTGYLDEPGPSDLPKRYWGCGFCGILSVSPCTAVRGSPGAVGNEYDILP